MGARGRERNAKQGAGEARTENLLLASPRPDRVLPLSTLSHLFFFFGKRDSKVVRE